MLREALALWRGPPLAELAFEPFAQAEIARLEEQRLTALEARVEADLAAGGHADAGGRAAAARGRASDARAARRAADARALPQRPAGRGARGLPHARAPRSSTAAGVEPGPELRACTRRSSQQDPSLELRAAPELPRGARRRRRRRRWPGATPSSRGCASSGGRPGRRRPARGDLRRRGDRQEAARRRAGRGGARRAAPSVHVRARACARRRALARRGGRRRALLVIDDADRAPAPPRSHGLASRPDAGGRHSARDARPPLRLGADETLVLGPLDAEAVRAIASAPSVRRAGRGAAGGERRRPAPRARGRRAAGRAARRRAGSAPRPGGPPPAAPSCARSRPSWRATWSSSRPRPAAPDRWRRTAGPCVCPFKGLASFDVADAPYFFGRERLVAELVARLVGAPLLGVVGPSGSGKSSVVRAGLLPALAGGVLPGSETLGAGAHAARRASAARARGRPPAGVDAGRVVLAVDQFEETFTACRDEQERAAFVAELVAPARRERVVVLAIRADYYGRCGAYPELSRLLAAHHVLVSAMRRDELRRAVERPAQRAGLRVEPELTDALVADVEHEPGALPMLSTALLELWQRRDGRRLRLADYERTGGVRGAVARHAEEAFGRLDRAPAGRRARRAAAAGHRGRRRRGRAPAHPAGRARPGARRRCRAGRRPAHRPAPADGQRGRGRARARGAAARVAAAARLARGGRRGPPRCTATSPTRRASGTRAGATPATSTAARGWPPRWSGAPPRARPQPHRDAPSWTPRRDAEQRDAAPARLARPHRSGWSALVVITGISTHPGRPRHPARALRGARRRIAHPRHPRGGATCATTSPLAALLGLEAYRREPTVEARNAVLSVLPLLGGYRRIGRPLEHGAGVESVAISPDGRTLASAADDGTIWLWDVATRRRLGAPLAGHDGDVNDVAFSPDGSAAGQRRRRRARCGCGTWPPAGRSAARSSSARTTATSVAFSPDGTTAGQRRRRSAASQRRQAATRHRAPLGRRHAAAARPAAGRLGDVESIDDVAFSPDGAVLAVAARDTRAAVGRGHPPPAGPGRTTASETVYAVAFSPDGRLLATADDDSSVRLWDVRTHRPLGRPLEGHASIVHTVAFSPDGRTLASGGDDGTVRLWSVATRRPRGVLVTDRWRPASSDDPVRAVRRPRRGVQPARRGPGQRRRGRRGAALERARRRVRSAGRSAATRLGPQRRLHVRRHARLGRRRRHRAAVGRPHGQAARRARWTPASRSLSLAASPDGRHARRRRRRRRAAAVGRARPPARSARRSTATPAP